MSLRLAATLAAVVSLSSLFAPAAHARSGMIESLASQSDLRTSEVRLVLAPARSAHPNWRHGYYRAERRLRATLGDAGFEALRAGRPLPPLRLTHATQG